MSKARPPSRNGPCPCKSGKPYKSCHGSLVFEGIEVHPASIFPGCLSPDGFRKAAQEFAKHAARAKVYGYTCLPNTVEFAGSRMVGVGGNIYSVDPGMVPINFMAELLVTTLGKEWFEAKLGRSEQPVHPIVSWYRDAMDWQQNNADSKGLVRSVMSGPASAWYLLAYDVWVLQHNSLLAPLLDRLRIPKEFQGTRYELTIFALFVRAGFKLNAKDTSDGNGRNVEFTATDEQTGERVAVEAKSKHRPGVLGFPTEGYVVTQDPIPNVRGVVRGALAQRRKMPYIICVDLNLPPADAVKTRDRMQLACNEIELIATEYKNNDEPFPATQIVLTNYPHHYGDALGRDPPTYYVGVGVTDAAYPFADPNTHEHIRQALDQYGNLPQSWDDLTDTPAPPASDYLSPK